jgi:hypothetical protein
MPARWQGVGNTFELKCKVLVFYKMVWHEVEMRSKFGALKLTHICLK